MAWEGYVLLDRQSEKAWNFPSITRLITKDEDVLHVEWGFGQQGKMDKKDGKIIRSEALQKTCPPLSGTFEITDENAAIWHFTVPEGEEAVLSMANRA